MGVILPYFFDSKPPPTWLPFTEACPREMRFRNGAHMEDEQPPVLRFPANYALNWRQHSLK